MKPIDPTSTAPSTSGEPGHTPSKVPENGGFAAILNPLIESVSDPSPAAESLAAALLPLPGLEDTLPIGWDFAIESMEAEPSAFVLDSSVDTLLTLARHDEPPCLELGVDMIDAASLDTAVAPVAEALEAPALQPMVQPSPPPTDRIDAPAPSPPIARLAEVVQGHRPPPTNGATLDLQLGDLGHVRVHIEQIGDGTNITIRAEDAATVAFFTERKTELLDAIHGQTEGTAINVDIRGGHQHTDDRSNDSEDDEPRVATPRDGVTPQRAEAWTRGSHHRDGNALVDIVA